MSPEACKFDLKLPSTGCTGRCNKGTGLVAFFTNYTVVQEATLPEEFFDNSARRETEAGLHPWNSPGSAPTFGNGCGANGGNPSGCQCQEDGSNNCYGSDDRGAGACCSK